MRKNVKGKIQQGRERDEEGKSTHSLHREIREPEKRVDAGIVAVESC